MIFQLLPTIVPNPLMCLITLRVACDEGEPRSDVLSPKKAQEVLELKAMGIQRRCSKSSIVCFPCCYPVGKAQPRVGMEGSQRDLPSHLQQKGDNQVPPLQLFSLNYFLYEKGQDKTVPAWGWDAHTGASWKDQ